MLSDVVRKLPRRTKELAKKDQQLDIELELRVIKEAFDKAKDQGYEGTIDQLVKRLILKSLKKLQNLQEVACDFSGLDVPTMKAIFRSEMEEIKVSKRASKGVKMYLRVWIKAYQWGLLSNAEKFMDVFDKKILKEYQNINSKTIKQLYQDMKFQDQI